jgi:hypothetical protein
MLMMMMNIFSHHQQYIYRHHNYHPYHHYNLNILSSLSRLLQLYLLYLCTTTYGHRSQPIGKLLEDEDVSYQLT